MVWEFDLLLSQISSEVSSQDFSIIFLLHVTQKWVETRALSSTFEMASETQSVKVVTERCWMPPTNRASIVHDSYWPQSSRPISSHVQQCNKDKIKKSLCRSTASYLKLVNGKCVDKGTISSLHECVCACM